MDASVSGAMTVKLHLLFPLSVLSFCLCSCQAKLTPHERTKRHLGFPNGAAFTVTLAMSTFLPKDTLPPKVPTGLAHIVEYDFSYRLPSSLILKPKVEKTKTAEEKKIVPGSEFKEMFKRKWKTRRRGKIYDQLSTFITLQGYDGRSCLTRLNCEVHEHLSFGETFIEDFLLAIAPLENTSDCDSSYKMCGVSPLSYLLHSKPFDDH